MKSYIDKVDLNETPAATNDVIIKDIDNVNETPGAANDVSIKDKDILNQTAAAANETVAAQTDVSIKDKDDLNQTPVSANDINIKDLDVMLSPSPGMNEHGISHFVQWFKAHFRNEYSLQQNIAAFHHLYHSSEMEELINKLEQKDVMMTQNKLLFEFELNLNNNKDAQVNFSKFKNHPKDSFYFDRNSKILAIIENNPKILDNSFDFAEREYPNNHNNSSENNLNLDNIKILLDSPGLLGGSGRGPKSKPKSLSTQRLAPPKRRKSTEPPESDDNDDHNGIYIYIYISPSKFINTCIHYYLYSLYTFLIFVS